VIVLEVLPFVLLSALAVGFELGLRRVAGPDRVRRVVRWLRPVPFLVAALVVRAAR
jgi:hypothetical protein